MSTLQEFLEDLGELEDCKRIAVGMDVREMIKHASPLDRVLILEAAQETLPPEALAIAAEED